MNNESNRCFDAGARKMTANSKNSKETRISNTAKKAVSKRKRAGGKKTVSRTRTAATSQGLLKKLEVGQLRKT